MYIQKIFSVCPSEKVPQLLTRWKDTREIFRAHLTTLQVIFGRMTRTSWPSGSGLYPEKGGFYQIYLLWGLWGRGVVSHHFGIGTRRQRKRWERNFDFWPTAQENRAGRWGWPGGQPKFWNLNFFKGTPSKIGRRLLFVLCNFLIRCTPRAPRVPSGPGRDENQF